MIKNTFVFDNGVTFDLYFLIDASELDIRQQVDVEISLGYHNGVDSSNTYTVSKGEAE